MDRARQVAERYGVAERCELVAGDFFQAVPPGDAFVLKTVLHDWDDARATRILRRCRQAMRGQGRVLVVESLLPERAVLEGPGFRGDVMMLVETGGRERTGAEFGALFAAAGMVLTEIRPLPAGGYAGRSLIEGVPAAPGTGASASPSQPGPVTAGAPRGLESGERRRAATADATRL
jgi:hypothetical protein